MANAKQPSFSLEALRQIIATPEARSVLKEIMKEEKQQERSSDMDALCISAFRRAGFKDQDIIPRENVKTYSLWIEAGRRVRPGESSVRVKQLRLFHVSQTTQISEAEKKEYLAQKAARTAELPKVTSVEVPKDGAKPAPKANGKPVLVPGSGSMQ